MSAAPTFEYATAAMSTTVSVQIVGAPTNAKALASDALEWFRLVESVCSRFDPASELVRLCRRAPEPTPVSPLLFEVLRLALAVSAASDGAFDPTLGAAMQTAGFDRHWSREIEAPRVTGAVSAVWRDIDLDEGAMAVALPRATVLDLGGIAKGFALDLAARALSEVPNCCLVAGGDLLCRGRNAAGASWRTAVVDPFDSARSACIVTVDAAEYAVCTSGDYARRTRAGHHLLDPRRGSATGDDGGHLWSAEALRSVTVVAPQAAMADALATAAFVLGPDDGALLLERQQVDGYLIDAAGGHRAVYGWGRTTFSRPLA